jgi:hypothetical protein
MVRIQRIALYTGDLDKEAKFCCNEFDVIHQKETTNRAIYLSEGYTNLGLLKRRGSVKPDCTRLALRCKP